MEDKGENPLLLVEDSISEQSLVEVPKIDFRYASAATSKYKY